MGFLKELFDTKFEHFITIRIIGFLMILGYVFATLFWLFKLLSSLKLGFDHFLITLILGGIVWLLALLGIRVISEIYVSLIKIAQDSADIKKILEEKNG